MARKNNLSNFQETIADPESRMALKEEYLNNMIESFNTQESQITGIVLYAEQNTTESSEVVTAIRVRAKGIHDKFLPDPIEVAKNKETNTNKFINSCLECHPVVFPQKTQTLGEQNTELYFSAVQGDIVELNRNEQGVLMYGKKISRSSAHAIMKYDFTPGNSDTSGMFVDSASAAFKNAVKGNVGFVPPNPRNYVKGPEPDPWKGVTIKGSEYPDDPIKTRKSISLNKYIRDEYIPARDKALEGQPLGLKLFVTAQAIKEGFYPNTRAYRYKNPGNIGNTDSGENQEFSTLEEGIKKQKEYTLTVANGSHKAYPLNKSKVIKPYYSPEIAKNQKAYGGRSPYVPGYEFTYTGQLDQYVKIYATAARSGNNYLSTIISYFAQNGITITPQSKIQDIIKMEKQ